MINDDRDPPAKWPALRQRQWQPGSPEAGGGWYDGQVDVPYVVGTIGRDPPLGRHGLQALRWDWSDREFSAHAAPTGDRQVQPGASQDLSDLDLAQSRAESLQTLNGGTHVIGEPIDRSGGLQQSVGPMVVESLPPKGDGGGGDLEDSGVCSSDQPRAARNSKIASLSVGR
jgi:hypothetical protein